jgi:hypothetical protein
MVWDGGCGRRAAAVQLPGCRLSFRGVLAGSQAAGWLSAVAVSAVPGDDRLGLPVSDGRYDLILHPRSGGVRLAGWEHPLGPVIPFSWAGS